MDYSTNFKASVCIVALAYTLCVSFAGVLIGGQAFDPLEQARFEANHWDVQAKKWIQIVTEFKQQYNAEHSKPGFEVPCPICQTCPVPADCSQNTCPKYSDCHSAQPQRRSLLAECPECPVCPEKPKAPKIKGFLSATQLLSATVASATALPDADRHPCNKDSILEHLHAEAAAVKTIEQEIEDLQAAHVGKKKGVAWIPKPIIVKLRGRTKIFEATQSCLNLTMPHMFHAWLEVASNQQIQF